MLFHTYTSNPFKERNYPYEPKWDDRLTYQFQENYYKINVKGPFTTYFGYESTRNCTELTAIDLDVCSKMSYLCADEIDSFQTMTLRLVLRYQINYELTNSPYLLKANTRVDRLFSVEQIVLVQTEGPRFCLRMKLPIRL